MVNPAPAGKLSSSSGASSELEALASPSESDQAPSILLYAESASDSLLLNASSSTQSKAFCVSLEATLASSSSRPAAAFLFHCQCLDTQSRLEAAAQAEGWAAWNGWLSCWCVRFCFFGFVWCEAALLVWCGWMVGVWIAVGVRGAWTAVDVWGAWIAVDAWSRR